MARLAPAGAIDVVRGVFQLRPAPVPWFRMAKAAVAIAVPVGTAPVPGRVGDGLLAALGAMVAVNSERAGPHRARATRMAASVSAGAVGLLVGKTVLGLGWMGRRSCREHQRRRVDGGERPRRDRLLGGAKRPDLPNRRLRSPFARTFVVAIGHDAGGWGLGPCSSVPEWVLHRGAPERAAVAAVFDAVADLAEASGGPGADAARRSLTSRLNEAEDAVLRGRIGSGGRDRNWQRLQVSLAAAGPLVDAAVTSMRAGQAPSGVAAQARTIAVAVRTGQSVSNPAAPARSGPQAASPEVSDRWERALSRSVEILAAARQPLGPLSAPGGRAVARDLGPEAAMAALRLALCLGVADGLRELVIQGHSYWIPLTVAVVMKPDFGAIFARALQRSIGTLVGVVVGGVALALVHGGGPLVPFVAVFGALLPYTIARNYAMFATTLTPLVLLLLGGLGPAPSHLVLDRLLDTLTGSGVVLVVGYLLWPGTWRPTLGRSFAEAAQAVEDYLLVALGSSARDPAALRRARRHAYRRLSDHRTLPQQNFVEPGTRRAQAAALWPATVALERLCDELARVGTRELVADTNDARRLAEAIADVAASASEGRLPSEREIPSGGPLAPLAAEVASARAAVGLLSRRRDNEQG